MIAETNVNSVTISFLGHSGSTDDKAKALLRGLSSICLSFFQVILTFPHLSEAKISCVLTNQGKGQKILLLRYVWAIFKMGDCVFLPLRSMCVSAGSSSSFKPHYHRPGPLSMAARRAGPVSARSPSLPGRQLCLTMGFIPGLPILSSLSWETSSQKPLFWKVCLCEPTCMCKKTFQFSINCLLFKH